jgi:branched-chain amino acid transport system substrate-binding protein
MQAMSRQTGDETLKAAVLKYGPYEGLQQPIQFDQFGDTARLVYFTEIRAGRFVLVK